MYTFSQEALERPLRTMQAAKLIQAQAQTISHATAAANDNELIVAVIQPDLTFGGVWTLARERFVHQALLVEDEQGWSLTFSPHTSVSDILDRCHTLSELARRRYELLRRRAQRQ
ncbi:hypothetical protein [Tengunoibacter tsumagoiensis]|uniref:Uncharacterized protein n=1 Tax=Tengunoibacter tsumagoiensis TaxID=2014871 RepID=A0A401ZZX6_9CHLR|nr:hypothetical protein [Tengunoibacter tsumagoiensis]GCE12428.1 hypothetical protein KTT_22870 [Tengunoibacter tsumagoiensis]